MKIHATVDPSTETSYWALTRKMEGLMPEDHAHRGSISPEQDVHLKNNALTNTNREPPVSYYEVWRGSAHDSVRNMYQAAIELLGQHQEHQGQSGVDKNAPTDTSTRILPTSNLTEPVSQPTNYCQSAQARDPYQPSPRAVQPVYPPDYAGQYYEPGNTAEIGPTYVYSDPAVNQTLDEYMNNPLTFEPKMYTKEEEYETGSQLNIKGPSHPREDWPAWKFPLFMVLLCVNFLLVGYDVSNIANIQAPIFKAFGNVDLLPWVALGYTVINLGTIPLVRKLLSLSDFRYQIAVYASLLVVGAAVSGSAKSLNAVIVGRCITGVGGTGLYQVLFIYNILITTPTEMARSQGLAAACWAAGLLLGPVVGGAFAQNAHATWRWAIYLNLPLASVIPLLGFISLSPMRLDPETTVLKTLADLDWVGAALHFSGCVFLCACMVFSGSTWEWHSRSAISAWIVAGVILICYFRQQMDAIFTTVAHRMFPVDLLSIRMVTLTCITTATAGASYGVTLYYTPLFFAFAQGDLPLTAAVHILPFIGTFIGMAILSGGVLPIIRVYAPFAMLGGACMIVGGALQTTISATTPRSSILGHEALIGAGTGMLMQAGSSIVIQSVPETRKLDGLTIFMSSQMGGIALALAVAGCVYQNVGVTFLRAAIGDQPDITGADLRQALAGVDAASLAGAPPELVEAVVAAVVAVIARINYMVVASGGLAFACGFLMDFKRLSFGRDTPSPSSGEETEVLAV